MAGRFERKFLTFRSYGRKQWKTIIPRYQSPDFFSLLFLSFFSFFFFEILVYCPSFRAEKEGTEVEARRSFLIVLSKKGGYS